VLTFRFRSRPLFTVRYSFGRSDSAGQVLVFRRSFCRAGGGGNKSERDAQYDCHDTTSIRRHVVVVRTVNRASVSSHVEVPQPREPTTQQVALNADLASLCARYTLDDISFPSAGEWHLMMLSTASWTGSVRTRSTLGGSHLRLGLAPLNSVCHFDSRSRTRHSSDATALARSRGVGSDCSGIWAMAREKISCSRHRAIRSCGRRFLRRVCSKLVGLIPGPMIPCAWTAEG